MVVKKVERTAKLKGDIIHVDGMIYEELSTGEFRTWYNKLKVQIGQYKDQIKQLDVEIENFKKKLAGKDMHLIASLKKDVELYIAKDFAENRVKLLKQEIATLEQETTPDISKLYDKLTEEEMKRREKEIKK